MDSLEKKIKAARGEIKADLVIKNGKYLNVFTNKFIKADIAVTDGKIVGIGAYEGEKVIEADGKFIVPSFINGHVHLESSLVSPYEYAKAAVMHGTTAIIADPHEIANVCGQAGIEYILESTRGLPVDVNVMLPSCVPATYIDENGVDFDSKITEKYLNDNRIKGLAEMMNYPGLISCDKEVLSKIKAANSCEKIIDGHAPLLSGKDLNSYVCSGVLTDHECTSLKEALEKLELGQWILIREGTASKNAEALVELIKEPYCQRVLFATDDKHPGEIKNDGEIDFIIKKVISLGADPILAYKAASFNAAVCYGLSDMGAIAPSYNADFVILDDYKTVKINSVYKNGMLQSEDNFVKPEINENLRKAVFDTVKIKDVTADDFKIKKPKEKVIGFIEGQIITTDEGFAEKVDVQNDILKLAVAERHKNTGHIGLCYVKGYGLKSGAVATSVSHDSHNIIVVGTNDEDMAFAVNEIKKMHGGMAVVNNCEVLAQLALPIAGLMCENDVISAQQQLDKAKKAVSDLGINDGIDPFMTLSFASLPVISSLRLTTLGVFDVNKFELLK